MKYKLAIAISLWGWLLFAAWLSYDYVEYGNRVFIHIFQESFSYEKTGFYILIILVPIVYAFIGFMVNDRLRLLSKLDKLEKHRTLSHADELTNLLNRTGFFLLGEQQLKIADRKKKGMLLVYIDLKSLRQINDAFGHKAGDMALSDIANIIKNAFRKSDIIARIGEDKFAILAIEASWVIAEIFAMRLQGSLEKYNEELTRPYKLSFNVGFSYYDPGNPCSLEELISRAQTYIEEEKQGKQVKEILGID